VNKLTKAIDDVTEFFYKVALAWPSLAPRKKS